MKFKYPLILIGLITLTGCGNNSGEDMPSFSSDLFDFSSEISDADPLTDGDGKVLIDFLGLNDFHGSLEFNATNREPGIARLASYLKSRRALNPGGTLTLSSGDMWQGSADSNLTQGNLVTMQMNYLQFDAMALGNHEFDWTTSAIYDNAEMADFPFLAANIYDKGTQTLSDLGQATTMVERGDIKIGIIGTIGQSLTESILASAVANYTFVSTTEIVKNAATSLRSQGADIVVLLSHDSWTSISSEYYGIINPSDNDGKSYVDLVFSGHAHTKDQQIVNGVPILQTQGNGKQVMEAQLAIDPLTKEIEVKNYRVSQDLVNVFPALEEDQKAKTIYDYYYWNHIKEIKEEVVGKLVGTLDRYTTFGNLVVKTMYNTMEDQSIVAAVHNYGGIRVPSIPEGKVTYGDIYKALPFDNDLVVLEVSGATLQTLMVDSDNVAYSTIPANELVATNRYKVVTISYLSEKLPSALIFSQTSTFVYVRDIVAELFREQKTVRANDYR